MRLTTIFTTAMSLKTHFSTFRRKTFHSNVEKNKKHNYLPSKIHYKDLNEQKVAKCTFKLILTGKAGDRYIVPAEQERIIFLSWSWNALAKFGRSLNEEITICLIVKLDKWP